jgi:hypothetical protein
MKVNIEIKSIYSIDEIPNYWTNEDYIALLDAFGFEDGKSIKPENLQEMLFMAIGDFEANEAAQIILNYKLSNDLNAGQIEQISNEMLIDKVCEEYPEIHMQGRLFHVNQLLFKAYNGKFPNTKASVVHFSMTPTNGEVKELRAEDILKLLNNGLSDRNLIKRLFEDQMTQNIPFPEAEGIIWELNTADNINFSLVTSENWINNEDITASEFESLLEEIEV